MLAVIQTGGKQYVVKEGDLLRVEKLGAGEVGTLLFDQVLLIDDGDATLVGKPFVTNAVVKATILETFKDEKVLVFKKKRRKQFRRTHGHRQTLTKVRIDRIFPDRSVVPAEDLAVSVSVAPKASEIRIKPMVKTRIAKAAKTAEKKASEDTGAKAAKPAKVSKLAKLTKRTKPAKTEKPKKAPPAAKSGTRAKKAEK